MARVFVTRALPGSALGHLAAEHEVSIWAGERPPAPEELRARVADADGLLCLLSDRVDEALLEAAPHLRAIANYAVGYDNLDVRAIAARGIAAGNTPGVLTEATADHAFALLLAAARHLVPAERAVRAGEWEPWDPTAWMGADVTGATLAIVGPGRIGTALAQRANGFEMRVVPVGRGDDLHAALREADFVSLHTPLTPETRHMIDATALQAMKPTAILVNTARGPVVDQHALAQALRDGTIAGAALDVTDPEPLPPDDPLLDAPNLLVVPHIASATRRTRELMADLAVDNLLAALAGRPMPNPVPGTERAPA